MATKKNSKQMLMQTTEKIIKDLSDYASKIPLVKEVINNEPEGAAHKTKDGKYVHLVHDQDAFFQKREAVKMLTEFLAMKHKMKESEDSGSMFRSPEEDEG